MNFKEIKVGHLVIVKRSGIVGRETGPMPVVEVTATEIILPHKQNFCRSNGEQVQEARLEKNAAGEQVKQNPDQYPARISRIATSEDIAKEHAKRLQSEESKKAMDAQNARIVEIAEMFPSTMRPHVEPAWSGTGLRVEFDGLPESIVRSIAELLAKAVRK